MALSGFVYLVVTVFCAVFGAVYEHFSHQVYSAYMVYAFIFPLVGGTVVFYWLSLFGKHFPGRVALNLYNSGIATLTVGSIFKGVLEIYGTTNSLSNIYFIVGIAFLFISIIVFFLKRDSG